MADKTHMLGEISEADRHALAALIAPELALISSAIALIERKVGARATMQRDSALQMAGIHALSSAQGIGVSLVGFCSSDDLGNHIFRVSSKAHPLFLMQNNDVLLTNLITHLVQLAQLQQYELPELAQRFREGSLLNTHKS